MKHYLVIAPQEFNEELSTESSRLLKTVYGINTDKIYFRVKTTRAVDNPRRFLIEGDGQIIEGFIKPQISLVHNLELDDIESFSRKVESVCQAYSSVNLEYDGIGNYDSDFTFFVRFKKNSHLAELRNELLELCKPFMFENEYKQYAKAEFIPHATILYDDIEPGKVMEAYRLIDRSKLEKDIRVKDILLWHVTPQEQTLIKKIPLGT